MHVLSNNNIQIRNQRQIIKETMQKLELTRPIICMYDTNRRRDNIIY